MEKNPNAYVLLQTRNRENWDNKVHVVKSDMRSWKGPLRPDGTHGKVDILVSELLGSFADNELSPECLDGVQHVLNPECGISIPESYTAFLTPISTPRLFSELSTKGTAELQPFEIPYVVMLHAYDFLSYEADEQPGKSQVLEPPSDKDPTLHLKTPIVKPCWTFRHPQPDAVLQQSSVRRGGSAEGGGGGTTGGEGANAHNTRFAQLSFPLPQAGRLPQVRRVFRDRALRFDGSRRGQRRRAGRRGTQHQSADDGSQEQRHDQLVSDILSGQGSSLATPGSC